MVLHRLDLVLMHTIPVQVSVKGADVNFRCAAEGVVIDDNKWLGENRERPCPPSLSWLLITFQVNF